jgi:ABC-type Na+ efflux pump permease subunit
MFSKMSNISIVAKREFITRVRTKSFIVGTLITIFFLVGGVLFITFFSFISADSFVPDYVKQSDVAKQQAYDELFSGSTGLTGEEMMGAVAVRQAEIMAQMQDQTDQFTSNPTSPVYWVGYIVAVLLFIIIQLTGNMIAQGTAEEKSSRVVEILLGTMSSFELLAGKVVGIATVGLLQFALIICAPLSLVIVGGGIVIGGFSFDVLGVIQIIAVMLAFFVVGYLSYAVLYAACASTVSRPEEVPQAIAPAIWILLIPYITICVPGLSDGEVVHNVLQYVPLFSAIAAPVFYLQQSADGLQTAISLLISIVALPGIVWVAGRVYSHSILQTGARIKLLSALRSK